MNSTNDPATRACLPAYEPQLVLSSKLPMGQCHLVIDTAVSGQSWGGFRVAQGLSLEEVKILARTMTIKTMLAGIPIGGAKGGVSISTSNYNQEEMLRLASNTVGPYVKQRKFFLGTDLGFSEADADFLYRCAGSERKLFSGGLTVGEACATGILASLEHLQRNGICSFGRTVAIEGFGRIGVPTAQLLSSNGYRIVAVSNIVNTLYDAAGLDVVELASTASKSSDNLISSYTLNHPDAAVLEKEEIYQVEADILIPGARALVLDGKSARQVRAKVVCPISNAPVTVDGEEALAGFGKTSVPDIISNTGGLIASFAQHLGASVPKTKAIISDTISRNLDSVFTNLQSGEVPKKEAVEIALERLREIRRSEEKGMLKFMLPWVRTLGLTALSYGLKEYIGLKFGG
jgi:glutamate dehydrogenase (NAD(P)+)